MDFTEEYGPLISSLMSLIRSSTQLSALDVGFVRSLSPELAKRSELASGELLDLINSLIAKSVSSTGTEPTKKLRSAADVSSNWRSIEQSFDLLMDKIDAPPSSIAPSSSNDSGSRGNSGIDVAQYMKLSNQIAKPQLKFPTKVDNSLRPFKPLLTTKPHASKEDLSSSLLQKQADVDHESAWYDQPYAEEIADAAFPASDDYDYEMPEWSQTPLTLVDTPEKLFKMVSKLEQAKAVAVDVEHHDYRSYLGMVCLLQISALEEDYVIDALALRSELQVLNKVFANPKIVKVLHGAKMDVMWLQRDLGVYIVNLFDTYFASRELQFPKLSLAYLLQRFVNFDAQKEFQLADWRVRPLPQELVDYARADTHFLLYIYGQLRKMLQNRHLLTPVVEASREVAAYRYEFPGWNEKEPQWYGFVLKHRLSNHQQRAVAIRLLEWRDAVARKHDESPRYVMSPGFLANLCVIMPHKGEDVIAAGHNVSHIVRQNASALADLIQKARQDQTNIDTQIPDTYRNRRLRNQEPSPDKADAPLSIAKEPPVNATHGLKRLHSAFMGESQPEPLKSTEPSIFLGVFNEKDLVLMQEALNNPTPSEPEPPITAAPAKPIKSEEPKLEESDPDVKTASKHGKRLNLVQDTEDLELGSSVRPQSKSRRLAVDEPAFDFTSASQVMSPAQQESRSYQQFGQNRGPKGAHRNTAKFKKGRSIR